MNSKRFYEVMIAIRCSFVQPKYSDILKSLFFNGFLLQGKPLPGLELAGGMEFPTPNVILRSPNITPGPQTGIGNWTETAFVQHFKIYAESTYHAPAIDKDGFNTPMPWLLYAGMKEADLVAIYA